MTGQTQVELGERWNLFSALVHNRFMAPLHDFLNHDLKSIAVSVPHLAEACGRERRGLGAHADAILPHRASARP